MTEATLLEWVSPDGARVETGDIIFRIEMEKSDADCEAPASGILRHLVEPGDVHQVGGKIGEIVAE